MKVDGIASGEGLEDMGLRRVGTPLHSHHYEPRPMRIARRVVNLSVIHLEKRGNELDEMVQHLLQVRRVTSEGHGGEENRYITPDNCFGDLAAGIRFHTHARRLDPAGNATETVGQFRFAQWKGLDLSTVRLEHVRQHVENGRQVLIDRSCAIENYDILPRHPISSASRQSRPAHLLLQREIRTGSGPVSISTGSL